VSSTCFEQPSVHLQEDLYKQFYGIKHILTSTRRLIRIAWKKDHKIDCTSFPYDEHLVVRNMSKAL